MSHTPEGWLDAPCGEAGYNSPTPADNTSDGKQQNKRQLTAARALEIFMLRPQLKSPGKRRHGALKHCAAIAPEFGVSAKTVREIWNRRSWARATRKEWTKEEIATGTSAFVRMMHDKFSGADSPPHSRIPALQHSLPIALGHVAPSRQGHAQTQHAAPVLGLSNSAVPSLQALLATAYAPQLAVLPPAPPQTHTNSAAQLLTHFAGFQTAPLHTAWGSGAETFVPAQDLELAIRSLQEKLALAKSQAQQQQQQQQQQFLQDKVHLFLQQRNHATEKAVAAMGGVQGQQSLEGGLPFSPSGMLSTNLSFNHHPWRSS